MAQRIQLRRGTASEWATENPVLALGEPGIETDTGKQKFGDGVTPWNGRPYSSKGDKGDPGPVGVADNASVAAAITADGPTKTALNATFATKAELEALPSGADPDAVASQAGASFFGPVPNVFTNLLTNPALVVDTSAWSSGYGTGGAGTTTRVAGTGQGGSFGYEIDWTTAPTQSGSNTGPSLGPLNNRVTVTPGGVYTGSIWVESDTDAEVTPVIQWHTADTGGSLILQTLGTVTMIRAGKRRRITVNGQAPATAIFAAVAARMNNVIQIGTGKLILSRAMLSPGYELTPYRDGTFPDAVWSGAAGASASTATMLTNRSGFGVAWGDSMTQTAHGSGDTFPNHLGDLIGVPVVNGGRGGETSTGIAIRSGGLNLRLTVAGNSIPASGAVTVTAEPGTLYRPESAWNFYGKLAGIYGTLTRAANTNVWTFTRTNTGSVTAVLPGAPFEVSSATDYADFAVIWAGHNLTDHAVVLRDVGAMVERARQQGQSFVVLSLLNTATQPAGNAGYKVFADLNAALATTYGAAFLDVRRFLIDHGLSVAGISATAGDTTAIAEDRVPPSLMFDTIHLNDAGRIVVAKYVAMFLTARNVAVAA